MRQRTLALVLAVLLPWGGARAAGQLCEKDLEPGAAFSRSALIDLVHEDYVRGRLDAVIEKLYRVFEDSLTGAERQDRDARIFLGRLKDAGNSVPQQWQLRSVQQPLGGQGLFSSDVAGEAIRFDCLALGEAQPEQYRRNMVSIAFLLQKTLLPKWNAEDRERLNVLSARLKSHEDLLANGLPMWPWELWLNGKRLGERDTGPLPGTQLVFMRPGVGLEINTRSREKADLEGSLLVEPLGMIWYRKPDFSDWIGVSAVVTSSTRQGMGYGFLLRYGRYTAGLTRHESATGREDTYLMLGFDLYDLLEKKRETFAEDRERLKRSARELVERLP